MEKFSELTEKLLLWMLKAVYYIMKVSFGLVIGTIIGLIINISLDNSIGEILFFTFIFIGLIMGIFYAEKVRKSKDSPYFKKTNL